MRESPSGQPNPSGSVYLDNQVIGPGGGVLPVTVAIPNARIGDTVAISLDKFCPMVFVPIISTNGQVVIILNNPSGAPYTVNDTTLYIETLRRG